jgi:hypothetical protein
MKNHGTKLALSAAGMVLAAVSANAQLVNEGAVSETTPSGTPLSVTYVSGASSTFTGTFNSWVIAAGSDSVATSLGYTGLTFVFQVNPTGPSVVESISLNGFVATSTSALGIGYLSGSANPISESYLSSAQGGISGGTVKVNFNAFSGTGDYVYIYTNDKSYGELFDSVQDGSSATPLGYAPIPEPTTVLAGALMLLPLGVGAFRAIRKDRIA